MSNDKPDIEPLSRMQVLIAMGVTAVLLLIVAKVWLRFDSVVILPVQWSPQELLLGAGIGLGITAASSVVYRLWPAYRRSADFYLTLVLKPLVFPDLIWLGLLPGLSEELLFRGVMLPAIGLNVTGLILSSICFGVLHLSGNNQWSYVVWATAVGLVFGYSALATGNLLVPIVAHILTNFISSLIWKLKEPQTT
ncbi:CPBP family intramembrane metalloprotease [Desertifilum sp. FACHB-1129]|uniref:Abortive phage infection protein n=1 Tax=Desertifilum tharense IPPAS B-1220 TaxID=1781255 RepID=A0A1E5QF33_9CYAN|nr:MULTISPECIES: CPBP family intramembrane glutamic endopeptidase [Desertifilum]MDA0208888.1 CPBP family intramembrane metalloprotease [Cyanobacteria bacterium FC1]MBD2314977.1 CPBP family intramembrane metalloprotease [Desertifilum sp. FACHB-1129]MBD2321494.1 CPBP family intramembrane metalloprotease [Desertifilum sp. FACHB-866]MBD2331199.1 CPBP family intramembrane metalloprotease [Desertifilum sp. FACHB-868]OEJ73207.1 abortive phage infection protein [Desertifilum tharense IPPAS B-1220]